MSTANIIEGDNRETLATLPAGHFHCCITSPPYYGLRDYGVACRRLGVDYTGCELNPEYIELSRQRFAKEANRGSTHKAPAPAPNQTSLFA